MKHLVAASIFSVGLIACGSDFDTKSNGMRYSHDFATESDVWTAGYADYPTTNTDQYELTSQPFTTFDYMSHDVEKSTDGHLLSGNNHSDDLVMYLKTPIDNLDSNQKYKAVFFLQLAANYGPNCVGTGGSPSDSVWIKSGIAVEEPETLVESGDTDMYRLNWDIGSQSTDGTQAIVLDTLTAPGLDCTGDDYAIINVNSADKTFEFTTDDTGSAWIFIGIDSGFEGTTKTYLTGYALDLYKVD
ncbi:hypothetical protein [Algibacillus agarilyticus]|uniref:hypothetical protein n=1 Tax=Algibacillus agarilyticus TaxID=2234133 RepID=UPI000DCFE177|nr:hypothetical protein [Algibacillus agarilyticus]